MCSVVMVESNGDLRLVTSADVLVSCGGVCVVLYGHSWLPQRTCLSVVVECSKVL